MATWDNSFFDVHEWDEETVEDVNLTLERTPARIVIEGENMAVRPIEIKVGNTRPWQFTLKDEFGGAVALDGATVKAYMRLRGASSNKIDGNVLSVTNTVYGVCEATVTSAMVDTAGHYDLEIEVTDSDTKVQRNFAYIPVIIRDKL